MAFQLVHCSMPVVGPLLDVIKVVEPLQCVHCSVPVVNKTMTIKIWWHKMFSTCVWSAFGSM